MARFTKPYERYAGKFYEIDMGDDFYILQYLGTDPENYLVFGGIFVIDDPMSFQGKPRAEYDKQSFAREFDGRQKKMTDETMSFILKFSHQIIKDVFKES